MLTAGGDEDIDDETLRSASQDEGDEDFELVDHDDDDVLQSPSQVDSDEMYLPAIALDGVKSIRSMERNDGPPPSQLFVKDGQSLRDSSNMVSHTDSISASNPNGNPASAADRTAGSTTFQVKRVKVTRPSASEKRLELIKAALDAKKLEEDNARTGGHAIEARKEGVQDSIAGTGASVSTSDRPQKKPRVAQEISVASSSNLPIASVTQPDTPIKRGNRARIVTAKAAAGEKARVRVTGKGKGKGKAD